MKFLITGGAGFIGSNLAAALLADGHSVRILDDLSRSGVDQNLKSLMQRWPTLEHVHADVREPELVAGAVAGVDAVYHLAAQVAVTHSIVDPRRDFETNTVGTLNVLEAARALPAAPIVIYLSTNKVYGNLTSVEVVETPTRYEYAGSFVGVSEREPLDFHSPYGCSKGAADQYVRDYARIYGLRTVVFRASCIYGPQQHGTADQGWVSHFLKSCYTNKPLSIYGDGKQVRDVLWVEDLVRALRAAVEFIDTAAGEVYNVGGGPHNTISVWSEFSELATNLLGRSTEVSYHDFRPGDQRIYVSDTAKLSKQFSWRPLTSPKQGLERLAAWIAAETDANKA